MARISIGPAKARATLARQAELEKALRKLYQEVRGVRSGLNYKIAGREAINARLNAAADQIGREANSAGALSSGLEQIIAQYERTERGNTDRVGAEKTSVQQTSNAGNSGGGDDGWPHLPSDWLKNWLEKHMPHFPTELIVPVWPLISGAIFPWLNTLPFGGFFPMEGEVNGVEGIKADLLKAFEDKDKGLFKKVSDFEDAHQTKSGGKYYYDLKTGKVTKINPNDEKAVEEFKKHNKGTIPVDVKLLGAGASGSVSVWGVSGDSGDAWDWGGVSGSVDVGKLEGNASIYGGVLGLGAAAGAGFTAFTAEEQAYLGTNDFQIYEKGSVSAGKVEAKGQIDVGLVDREGHFNPSLYGGLSAEALAGEVSGTVGIKALGADIGVEGSLNYGIGAHANVGFHDGKLSLDVGATLGVGASVKLDIDVSGTIEAVGDFVGEVGSGVKDFISWLNPWD